MPRLLRYARASHEALADNEAHQFALRYALAHFASGTVCSFIPKNCCTTLRYTLAVENGFIQGPEDFGWIHKNNRSYAMTLRELALAEYTFAILRDPATRLSSAFLDKVVTPGETRSGELFRFCQAGGWPREDSEALTFRAFCTALADPAVRGADPHWRPQVDFLVYETYDDWFAFEHFPQAAARIEARTGMTMRDARALSRHGTDQAVPAGIGPCADAPLAELRRLKREGRLPTHDDMLDASLRALIARTFAEDHTLRQARIAGP